MSVPTDALAALQAAITEHAREVSRSHHIVLPGHETPSSEWPEAVRSAQDFHASVLQHGELGDVFIRRLPNDLGGGWLLVAHQSESRWGVAEIYSPQGEFVAAGVYLIHGPFIWQERSVVRQAAIGYQAPIHLIPKDAPLEWVTYGTGEATHYESVGGRFFISPTNPGGDPNSFLLRDGVTNLEHTCDSADAARDQALAIQTASCSS